MRILALLFVLSLAAVGCKDDEPTPPPAPGAMGGMPPGHPGGASGQPATGLPDLPSGNITGTVQVSKELVDKVTAGDIMFVMARNAATGTLIAVSRVEVKEMPASFVLTGGGAMHGGSTLAGKVKVEARVDKDGDAMTKNPGDVIGESEDLVTVPAENVVLTLTKTL